MVSHLFKLHGTLSHQDLNELQRFVLVPYWGVLGPCKSSACFHAKTSHAASRGDAHTGASFEGLNKNARPG